MIIAQRLFGEGYHRAYTISLGMAVAFSVIHLIALPIVVTPDGFQYLFLSEITLEPGYFQRFQYVRGPLFPLLIKSGGILAGRQGDSVVLVNVLLTLVSVVIIGALARRFTGNIMASLVILACAFNPVSVAYSHAVLQQAGIGFFVCALAGALLRRPYGRVDLLVVQPFLIVGIVSVGYYFAPNLRVLVFPALLLHSHQVYRWMASEGEAAGAWRPVPMVAAQMVAILVACHLLQLPWKMALDAHGGDHREVVLAFGLMNQAIPDPETSRFVAEDWRDFYRKTVGDATTNGYFALSGMVDQPGFYRLHAAMKQSNGMAFDTAGDVFFSVVAENPWRYIQGVIRTFIHLIGIPSRRSEDLWIAGLAYSSQSKHGGFTEEPKSLILLLQASYEQRKGSWAASPILRQGVGIAKWIAFAGWLATISNFGMGLYRRRGDLLTISIVPLAFLGSFCVILLSVDRYAAPLMFLVFLNLIVAGHEIWRWKGGGWVAWFGRRSCGR